MTSSLKEQQARAREEFYKEFIEGKDWGEVGDALSSGNAYADWLDSLIARVRTETIDAVEAGMPDEHGTTAGPCHRREKGQKCESCAEVEGWNRCRAFILPHLRALREGNK